MAIQTIYRELDRARTLIQKQTKQDDDNSEELEEDWTIVEESEEMDGAHPFAMPQPLAGIKQDASQMGGGSLVLGSMVLKGTAAQKHAAEVARRN